MGARPTRRLSLQPEATGAGMEETKCLKPLVSQAAPGGVQPRGDRLPTAHGLRTGAPSARVRPTTSALSAGRTFIERSHAPLAGNLGGRSSMPAKGPGTTVIRPSSSQSETKPRPACADHCLSGGGGHLPAASFAYFLLSQDNVHYEMLPAAIDLHLGRIVTIHRGKGRDGHTGAAL